MTNIIITSATSTGLVVTDPTVLIAVLNAGSTMSTTLQAGAEAVSSGGYAISTIIDATALQAVDAGGTADYTDINSGGHEVISSGGTVLSAQINSGGLQSVSSGGSATGTIVSKGGEQDISFGGSATATAISNGGLQYIETGATAAGATISSGGVQQIYGTASSATVSSGGQQQVYNGGIAVGTVVSNQGAELLLSSGIAISTIISSGGYQGIQLGGIAVSTIIANSGDQYITDAGTATATIVSNGGIDEIGSGGTAISATISAGGIQYIVSSGTASSTTISTGGIEHVSSGGVEAFATVSSGGELVAWTGGRLVSATVVSSGNAFVESGGVASSTHVSSGGFQILNTSGIAVDTILNSGGYEAVEGGTAISTTVYSTGEQYAYSAGVEVSTIVSTGGFQVLYAAGSAVGSIVSAGGYEFVSSGGTTSFTNILNSGVEAVFAAGGALATNVGSGGSLIILSGGIGVSATISSGATEDIYAAAIISATTLLPGATVDLTNFAYVSNAVTSLTSSTDTLTVTAGGASASVSLNGSYAGDSFVPYADGNGGTDITVTAPVYVTQAASVTVIYGQATTIGSATAGNFVDPLAVTLLSDSDFSSGSSLSVSGGSILYTAGPITSTTPTTDTLSYQVTDTTTGGSVMETQTINLSPNSAYYLKSALVGGVVEVQIWAKAGTDVESAAISLNYSTAQGSYASFTPVTNWTPQINTATPGTVSLTMSDITAGSDPLATTADSLLGTVNFSPVPGAATFVASGNVTTSSDNHANTYGPQSLGSTTLPIGTTLTGLVYTWDTHALLSGVTITATSGSTVLSATTNASGAYSLTLLEGSTYAITESLPVAATAGVTSLEALDALKLSVGINPNTTNAATGTKPAISPYEDMAADVLGRGTVTSLDALDILKMSVGLSSAPAQKWEFVPTSTEFWNPATGGYSTTPQSTPTTASTALSITANASAIAQNFSAVLTGNVNGSLTPSGATANSAPTATLEANALAAGDPADQFAIASYTVSTLLAATLTAPVDVIDTAANVAANIDQLQSVETSSNDINGIWLSDSNDPTVTFTASQASHDAQVLGEIIGTANITITASAATTSLSIAELAGPVNVTMAGNLGSVSVAGSAISFITPPGTLTLGSGADVVNFNLAPASGVEEVTNFTLGTDVLNITLNGNTLSSALVTYSPGGSASPVQGEFLYSATDPTHGVLLLGVTLPTSGAGGLSSHITTNAGVATMT